VQFARREPAREAQSREGSNLRTREFLGLLSARRNLGRKAPLLCRSSCTPYIEAWGPRAGYCDPVPTEVQSAACMGWYFRKSVGFGPLRLNLSKSGIGASVGVRGARIGVGPRGNSVRLGRGGLYYQQYLHSAGEGTQPRAPNVPATRQLTIAESGVPIVTADVSRLQDSTAEVLLTELRDKQNKFRLAPIGAASFLLTTILLLAAGFRFGQSFRALCCLSSFTLRW
jgi:Protein of unknown function (DUF4236)